MDDSNHPHSDFDSIVIGGTDRDNRPVTDVYANQRGRYAVYQTPDRVVVHYADDPLLQRLQRQRLARVAAVRSEINGTLAVWRKASYSRSLRDAALRYDMLVASALIEGLEGSTAASAEILAKVAADIRGARASRARLYYLLCTIIVAAVFLVVCSVAIGIIPNSLARTDPAALSLWHSVAAGVLGSVYSIALGMEDRSLTNDRRVADHLTDALVRISIGALAAFVIGNFLLTGAVQINFGSSIALPAGSAAAGGLALPLWPVTMITGFLAGFAERLVPDLLSSYSMAAATGAAAAGDAATPPTASPTAAAAAEAAAPSSASEQNASDKAADASAAPLTEDQIVTPPSDEEAVDGCDVDLAANATATPDDSLPPASGGVAPN